VLSTSYIHNIRHVVHNMYLRIPQYISTTYVKLSTRYTTWSTICVHILSCVVHNMFSTTYTVYSTGYRYTLWVTCCGDVYIYCGEQRAYVVGDTRVPHNICFWCCPQHVTHKLCQGCSPQHMSPVPHNISHALHNLSYSRKNELHQIWKTSKDMLYGYPFWIHCGQRPI
jgi:hypothetical protein